MKLIDTIRAWFTPPGAVVLAARELEEAKRQLLEAQSGREYADGLCRYHTARITRLTSYLKEAGE